jgi:acyl-CoA hydrolase
MKGAASPMKEYVASHLVKSEDLNHHGTLFAGRMAEWFVEAAFIAGAAFSLLPHHLVCFNIHGLVFRSPVQSGDIVAIRTRIVLLGTTRIVVYGKVLSEMTGTLLTEGFITFVSVDDEGSKKPHGLVLDETADAEELYLREKARHLAKN